MLKDIQNLDFILVISSNFWKKLKIVLSFIKISKNKKRSLLESPKEKGIDLRKELIAFHHKYYAARGMTACIVGKEVCFYFEKNHFAFFFFFLTILFIWIKNIFCFIDFILLFVVFGWIRRMGNRIVFFCIVLQFKIVLFLI